MQVFPTVVNAGDQVTVRCSPDMPGQASIVITDIAGREMGIVHNGCMTAGASVHKFSIKDLASGVYFVVMRQGSTQQLEKFVVR